MIDRVKRKMLIPIAAIMIVIVFSYFQNNSIVTTKITIDSEYIPQNFDDYKIVHLSDLHNKSFGNNQSKLVKKVNHAKPDLIVFTGDLIDSKKYNEKPSLFMMEKLVQIAPVYYVTGNHEWLSGKFNSLESKLTNLGVHVMRNATENLTIGNDKIQIVGIDDPANVKGSTEEKNITENAILHSIEGVDEENFKVLLSHRPEMFPLYTQYKFDLVFSGHAHGGQFRIPFVGGLIAPNQGLFPMYTSGKHTVDNTTMIVSRGLGNSIIPLRIFNRPEIVIATLKLVKK